MKLKIRFQISGGISFKQLLNVLSVCKASAGSQSFAVLSVGLFGWRLDRKVLHFQGNVRGKSRQCIVKFI